MFPQLITLPYAEAGINLIDTADATGFKFQLEAGQQLEIAWQKYTVPQRAYFGELWQINSDSSRRLLQEADTALNKIYYLTATGGDFIFRFQPALGAEGRYALQLNASPFSLTLLLKMLRATLVPFGVQTAMRGLEGMRE